MKHNRYIHSAGSEEARAAVAKRYSSSKAPLTPDDILITSGCSGAIDIALRGLLKSGDNILHLKPGFPFNQTLCAQNEFESRFYNLMVCLLRIVGILMHCIDISRVGTARV